MPYKCLIVDDEELARELIEAHLSQLKDFELVASCENALEARIKLKEETIDLIFLDIEMPVLKGTDFLKNLSYQLKVIFTTAYRDYAIEGFELNAVDYLLKPIEFERFFQAIEKFIERTERPKKIISEIEKVHHIYIQSNKKYIKILLDDILYVEGLKNNIRIHFINDNMMIKSGLTEFEQKLDNRFLRIHRSFIVNTDKISAHTKQDVEIETKEIPIGEYYKKEVLKKLK